MKRGKVQYMKLRLKKNIKKSLLIFAGIFIVIIVAFSAFKMLNKPLIHLKRLCQSRN